MGRGRSDQALRLFRAGLELDPAWREGWWRLGLIQASEERFDEARVALLRLVALEPDAGPAFALLGLCEYRLALHDQALAHLWKGTSLGLGNDDALRRESLLHFALLHAQWRLRDRVDAPLPAGRPPVGESRGRDGVRSPGAADAPPAGRGSRRRPGPGVDRGTGPVRRPRLRADEAKQGFDDLVARYPRARGTHFIYGVFLRHQASPEALGMLRQELELFPDHAGAHLEIALRRSTAASRRMRWPRPGPRSASSRRRPRATWRSAARSSPPGRSTTAWPSWRRPRGSPRTCRTSTSRWHRPTRARAGRPMSNGPVRSCAPSTRSAGRAPSEPGGALAPPHGGIPLTAGPRLSAFLRTRMHLVG